jgi:transposase
LHVHVDGRGRPLLLLLSPGQSSDHKGFAPLVDGLQVRSGQHGRPRSRPRKIVADAAYLARSNRRLLRCRGIGCGIPRARTHRRRGPFDKAAYRQRNQVERFFARIKQFRRMATGYEKFARHYMAIVTLAATVIWLRELA